MPECLDDFEKVSVGAATVFHGSNLDVLPFMADNSVDSIVCDPPYELGFMGKSWDSSGIAYSVELWRECLRVLKPGGHLLAFGGTRTWHRIAVAIEDAGFDVRDSIAWLYGSGFPKSMNIALQLDKKAGLQSDRGSAINVGGKGDRQDIETSVSEANGKLQPAYRDYKSPEAEKWAGWGTALKPAFEPVVVARKPLIGTVAANVLEFGVGGLNIDASRIGTDSITINTFDNGAKPFGDAVGEPYSSKQVQGRWPANIILDEYTAGLLDEQSGISVSKSGGRSTGRNFGQEYDNAFSKERERTGHNDSGGASRFFYVSKANKRDRNEGDVPNTHPTVKPTDLMRYLIKLVTPAGGIVLDPFTGSGSTGKAALLDGYQFIGIELTADYLPIIEGRLQWAEKTRIEQAEALVKETEERLF
jgi:site-specific DNA-methyltransferase (adenine-specific)